MDCTNPIITNQLGVKYDGAEKDIQPHTSGMAISDTTNNLSLSSLKRMRSNSGQDLEATKKQCIANWSAATTLNSLPYDLFMHICRYLGVEVLRLSSVNLQFCHISKCTSFNIGYQSLLKILQIEQKAFREGLHLYRIPLEASQHLPITLLTLAKVSLENNWLEQLHRIFPLHTNILLAEQFEELIESNFDIATSYLSMLVALRPTFPPAYGKEFEYENYVEDLVDLMEKFQPHEKQPITAHWLSLLGADWGIGAFNGHVEDMHERLEAFLQGKSTHECPVFHSKSIQSYLEILLRSTLYHNCALCIAIMQKIGLYHPSNFISAFKAMIETSSKNKLLADKVGPILIQFYRQYNPEWLINKHLGQHSLLRLIAAMDLGLALTSALQFPATNIRHLAAQTLVPAIAQQMIPESIQILQLLHSEGIGDVYADYPSTDDILHALLDALLSRLDKRELSPQAVAPLIKQLHQDLRIKNEATGTGIYVHAETHPAIMASIFEFFAFHLPHEAPLLFKDVHVHVMEKISFDLESAVRCAKAFIHLDANHIQLLLPLNFDSKVRDVLNQLVLKSLQVAFKTAMCSTTPLLLRLRLINALICHLDTENSSGDILLAKQISSTIKNLPNNVHMDPFYCTLTCKIAKFDSDAACDIAARISDDKTRAYAYLSAYSENKKSLMEKMHQSQQQVFATCTVPQSEAQNWENYWRLYAYVDPEIVIEKCKNQILHCKDLYGDSFNAAWNALKQLYRVLERPSNKLAHIKHHFLNQLMLLASELDDYAPQKLELLTWLRNKTL